MTDLKEPIATDLSATVPRRVVAGGDVESLLTSVKFEVSLLVVINAILLYQYYCAGREYTRVCSTGVCTVYSKSIPEMIAKTQNIIPFPTPSFGSHSEVSSSPCVMRHAC